MTLTTLSAPGNQVSQTESVPRLSGTNLFRSSTTQTTYPMTPAPSTSLERPWTYRELTPGYYTLNPMTANTPIPSLPSETLESQQTQSPSQPCLATDAILEHGRASQTTLTPVTTPLSQTTSDNDRGETTLPTPSSMNPFHAGVPQTLLTPTGLTTSGMSSNRSTETYSDPTESPHGSYNERTWRHEPAHSMPSGGSTWSTSLPLIEGLCSILEHPLAQRSWHGSMPTETGSYTPHTQAYSALTYATEPLRSSTFSNVPFSYWPDSRETIPTWMGPSTNPYEGFIYDYNSIASGFQPSEHAEDFYP
ncbi:hypothetical protein ARMGADRAFT_1091507 [Armillaria gallica]|uniref:Uncharacterized protein n=1 Tax=Armillaria gallica TaxID=47427 RepID=A0A2H3CWR1_ARMGA|nr:hypothetical protein ARMGADRAFT_1091507 [Armillaria gallica]